MKAHSGADNSVTGTPSILGCRFQPADGATDSIGLAVTGTGPLMGLSALLPSVENLGAEVITSHSVRLDDGWQIDLQLRPRAPRLLGSTSMQARFADTLLAIHRGSIDNDGFNRLVTLADFDLRACVLVRAIARYLLQVQLPFSLGYMEEALCRHPEIALAIVELFRLKFDPDRPSDGADRDLARTALRQRIEAVESLDDDRILNAFIEVVDATVRSNFFLPEVWREPGRCLALKLLPAGIALMPKPVPAFEIFVFGTAVEGVHLRGGAVARGGLRWSERMEDYRTEVLGLVKAQMVKNAVIVPTGAKGGFICKTLAASDTPEQRQQRVRAAYSSYIQALLDLTDNRIDGAVVPPPRVVRYDSDDAYLVVAADKGTATFSDTANAIALKNGFWLGDAFASGGSHGYDHKKMGITARGAWESARRLFRERGLDTQCQPFTVIGIGDMSGDVFGNGMLLSDQIRLLAAFNHQHIFIDPDPDPAISFAERQRLFALPRSGWGDYDRTTLSAGGGIYARSAKRIELSPQACRALRLGDDTQALAPDALIRRLLQAEVDLLWNGGIGTYVRASHERDAEVGDRANDPVRVSAAELGARVVVEGGNLGLTQAARIEFAHRGGLISTDAIDNSAGVDCSDHEVNIKILLNQLVSDGQIDGDQRDRLLEAMTDEVAALVLRNNHQQSKMLSQSNRTAPAFLAKHAQLIQLLEREGRLDRQLEQLPDDAEIEQRLAAQQGLTRPEIAVLLAYAKSRLYETLIGTDVIDDPSIARELFAYFPARLQEHYREAIAAHPLRKEILAAQLTNQVMNRMGSTFCLLLLENADADCGRWIRSYTVAREALGVPELVREIDGLGFSVGNEQQMDLQLQIHHPLERATHWLLEQGDWRLDTPTLTEHFRTAVAHARGQLPEADADAEPLARLQARVADLEYLYYGFDIAAIAQGAGCSLETAATAFFALNRRLELFWLRHQIEGLPALDRWHRRAKTALVRDLDGCIKGLLIRLLATGGDQAPSLIQAFLEGRGAVRQFCDLVSEIKHQPSPQLAMLMLLGHRARSL